MKFTAAFTSVVALAAAAEAHVNPREIKVDVNDHLAGIARAHHNHAEALTERSPLVFGGKIKTTQNQNAPVGGLLTGLVTALKGVTASADAAKAAAGGKTPEVKPSAFSLPTVSKTGSRVVSTSPLTTFANTLGQLFNPSTAQPVVKLGQGTYYGVRSPALFQQEWFQGIPFAKPPVGDLRFRAPQPLDQSTASFNATKIPAACPQPSGYLINFPPGDQDPVSYRSEDCLTVNVWSPIGASSGALGKLPVLLWYYGGGNIGNSHNVYNSSGLVLQSILQNQPMIVVTPNYRGNSFGFLAGKKIAAGSGGAILNPGMRDVTFAAEWTKANIAAFGGDPNKITIAGQSSGAFNVATQLLKDGKPGAAPPVYRAAVMLSGTSMSEPAVRPDSQFAEDNFRRICKAVNCNPDDDNVIDGCLRKVDAITLGNAAFYPSNTQPDPSQYWIQGPMFYAGNQPFQTVQDNVYHDIGVGATQQVNKGWTPDVPILTGNTRDEGTIFVSHNQRSDEAVAENLATLAFPDRSTNTAQQTDLITKTLAIYPNDPTKGAPFWPGYRGGSRFGAGNQFERLAAILTDLAFITKRRHFLDVFLARKKSPVYAYHFEETVDFPDVNNWVSIAHGTDPPFWFAALNFAPRLTWLPSYFASKQASSSFIAFVNKLNPNMFGNPFWPQYTANNKVLMSIQGWSHLIKDDFRTGANDLFTSEQAASLLSV